MSEQKKDNHNYEEEIGKEILDLYAKSEDESLRAIAASHSNTSKQSLKLLYYDYDQKINFFIILNTFQYIYLKDSKVFRLVLNQLDRP